MTFQRWFPLLAAVTLTTSGAVRAQEVEIGWDPGRVQVTRADLQAMLQRLDQAASSPSYSKPVREKAQHEAQMIRQRLAEGDFRVGDQIMLIVEGEEALSDTFPVRDGRVVRLPTIGDITLNGVLRAELEEHMHASIAKYVRNPVVRAKPLIRLSMLGEVTKPGFYVMPTDILVSDALMLAGGPTATAKVAKVRIERDGEPIWAAEALQEALAEGRTLDQLNLRAGDQVVVPKTNGSILARAAPVVLALVTTAWLIFDNDN
jgi:polysaccharide biosynthesis/export protein